MKAMNILSKIRDRLNGKWDDFLEKLQSDSVSVDFNDFVKTLHHDYGIKLPELEQ